MAIEFVCPTCNGTLQVGDEMAGGTIRCGGCQSMLRVPAADAPAPGPPASPFEAEPPPRRTRPGGDEPRPDRPRRRRRDPDRDGDDYDDRAERPRRRREDEPPPPPGRGAFFWLVVLGGVLFIGLLGCCGGLFLALPKEEWHTHKSDDGGFTVELPAKPQPNIAKSAGLNLEEGTKAEGTVAFRRFEHFLVVYRKIPSTKDRVAKGESDETELEARVQRVLGATTPRGQRGPVREKSITVDGFPGRELEYEGKGGNYTVRVVVADTRLYIVLASGPQPHDNVAVRRFIDSFHITDAKLVEEGERRKKEAGAKKEGDKPRQPAHDKDD